MDTERSSLAGTVPMITVAISDIEALQRRVDELTKDRDEWEATAEEVAQELKASDDLRGVLQTRVDVQAEALREARDELDAWRRFAQVRGMGAARTHKVLIARIDAVLGRVDNGT